jgi:hypothetical protein
MKFLHQALVQDQHHFQIITQRIPKALKGPPHKRSTLQQYELLCNRLLHARARSTGHKNQVLLHPRAAL